ncbi:VOC family protein [uncultured Algimonas sp.]|uniref:VOC family protein n=1 Tax=uncultured Algimonas sp. TaxID=1547920 RepID=UPI002614A122|nr:VOC family protein [uncultured Algimonas sp.]
MTVIPFHLAAPIRDKEEARLFYRDRLGCAVGREAENWIDFDFFGHQVSLHVCREPETQATNEVDGKQVPVRHFGAVLPWERWHVLKDRLAAAGTDFVIEPYIRFEGEPGEQATMFFLDPSGNALEFKSFKDPERLYAT